VQSKIPVARVIPVLVSRDDNLRRLAQSFYGSAGLLLTLTGLFWAGNAIAGRLAVGQVTPLTLTSLRWVLVILVLWPIYGRQVREHWPKVRGRLLGIVLMATMGFTGFNVLYYVAAHHTTAINLGILQGSIPVFVLGGAFVAHGTRVSLAQMLGVLITLGGVVVIATQGEPLKLLEIEFNQGDLLMLAACVIYALYTLALRDRPQMPGVAFFTLLVLIATLTSLPLVAFEAMTTGLMLPTAEGLLVTAYVAIFPSCLAQIFLLRGVDLIGPGRAGVYVNLVPVFAAILAVGLLGEPFTAVHAVALVLVIGGILLAQRAPKPVAAASEISASKQRE
jgi:drug/metabolite transporter (DMT)-like permease